MPPDSCPLRHGLLVYIDVQLVEQQATLVAKRRDARALMLRTTDPNELWGLREIARACTIAIEATFPIDPIWWWRFEQHRR